MLGPNNNRLAFYVQKEKEKEKENTETFSKITSVQKK